MIVYLSGRIDHLTYEEAVAGRRKATEMLLNAGWDVLDPMRGKEALASAPLISATGLSDAAIVYRDLDDIRRADVVLVLTASEPSYGTLMEWGIAAHEFAKPVVAVDPLQRARQSPWCRYFTLHFADSIEDAVDWISSYLTHGKTVF